MRKSIPAVYLGTALLLICSQGLFADVPLICAANSGVFPPARSDGVSELVGDLILNCNGGVPTAAGAPIPLSNVQIFLNTNVTSRLIGLGGLSEATLTIDEALPGIAARVPDNTVFVPLGNPPPQVLCVPDNDACPAQGNGFGDPYERPFQGKPVPTVYTGRQTSLNSILWSGVPIDATGPDFTRVLRISNIRVKAWRIADLANQVFVEAFVAITGPQPVLVLRPQQALASLYPALEVTSGAAVQLSQCVSHNVSLLGGAGTAAFDFSPFLVSSTVEASVLPPTDALFRPSTRRISPAIPITPRADFTRPGYFPRRRTSGWPIPARESGSGSCFLARAHICSFRWRSH